MCNYLPFQWDLDERLANRWSTDLTIVAREPGGPSRPKPCGSRHKLGRLTSMSRSWADEPSFANAFNHSPVQLRKVVRKPAGTAGGTPR